MKCPLCEKRVFYDSTGKISHYEKLWNCQHCGGKGEIPDESWWLCEVLLPPDGDSWNQVLYYEDETWFESDSGGTVKETSVRPIVRMKEVP